MPATAIRVPLARVRLGRLADDRLAALSAEGEERAFEALYDRHHRALLGFCHHMLGSREEGEDALQQTFLRAHRSLLARGAPDELRPWLFAIARNRCLTLLAARKVAAAPVEDLEPATEGFALEVERRADLRLLLADIERLPESQRSALVLAELADLSHAEIASVIDVPPGRVKALIHQARTRLIADREARETPCEQVREQLATARGGTLRRGPLRRHLSICQPCRAYKSAVAHQRAALGLALPVLPSAGLKEAIFGAISGGGGGTAVAAAGAASGGGAGLAAKLAVGAALAGGAGGGAIAAPEVVTSGPDSPARPAAIVQAPGKASGAHAGRGPALGPPAGLGTSETAAQRRASRTVGERASGRRRGAVKRLAREQAKLANASRQRARRVGKSERAAHRAAAKEQRRALRVSPTKPAASSQAQRTRSGATKAPPPAREKARRKKTSTAPPAAPSSFPAPPIARARRTAAPPSRFPKSPTFAAPAGLPS